MTERVESLQYAVRLGVVAKYLGELSIILAAIMLVPLIAALVNHELLQFQRYLIVLAILAALGALARLPSPMHILPNEAMCVIALAFILTPLLLSYPMMAGDLSFIDALFESVSGITTTGLSTLSHVEDKSSTFLLSRAWTQWYGGLGIVVLSVALLMGHHIAARQLAHPNGADSVELATTTRAHARRVLAVYLVITTLSIGGLMLCGMDGFHAVTHALSAVSTGGFSSYNNSLLGLNNLAAQSVLMGISFCGAVSMALYYRGYRNGIREILSDMELRALVIATGASCALLAGLLFLNNHMEVAQAIHHGVLMGISSQSTTGFSSLNVADLSADVKLAMILSMAVGGTVGSTAGGMKLLRILIFFRLLQFLIQRTAMPAHAVNNPILQGRKLERDEITRALILILLFLMVIILSWWIFIWYGYPPLDALFEVVSATATVGLSTGITSAELATPLKLVLCADMWLGRLEIIAILVVLYPWTWIGKRTENL